MDEVELTREELQPALGQEVGLDDELLRLCSVPDYGALRRLHAFRQSLFLRPMQGDHRAFVEFVDEKPETIE